LTFDAFDDFAEHLAVRVGAAGAFGVRVVALEPAAVLQEHRGGVLVGGHGRAEGEEAEVLEQVVEFVERRIATFPEFVTLREEVRGESAQAQQVIAAVHHHVDGEIVAGVDLEVGSDLVAQNQSLPFQVAPQRRVLGPEALGDAEQTAVNVQRINLPEGGEHRAEFEPDEAVARSAEPLVSGEQFRVG